MWDGKKATAMRVFYDALDQIKKRMPDVDPIEVFTEARRTTSSRRSKSARRRVGGANYQVPMQVKPKRQQSLAIRWILAAIRGKAGRPMFLRLADELMAAYRREGEAMSQARADDQDGRGEQGVLPLRLVSRSDISHRGTEAQSRTRSDWQLTHFLSSVSSLRASVPLWLITVTEVLPMAKRQPDST